MDGYHWSAVVYGWLPLVSVWMATIGPIGQLQCMDGYAPKAKYSSFRPSVPGTCIWRVQFPHWFKNRPYSHKLLTINNYVNCPSNFAYARSIYLFYPPVFWENRYANTVYMIKLYWWGLYCIVAKTLGGKIVGKKRLCQVFIHTVYTVIFFRCYIIFAKLSLNTKSFTPEINFKT